MRRAILGLCGGLILGQLGAACEDPPPPTPAGAYTIAFSQPGGTCSIGSHESKLGEVGASGDPTLVTSGDKNSTTDCTIETASGGFKVTARVAGSANLSISIPSISSQSTQAEPADGTVSYASSQTAGDVFSSQGGTPCRFWVDTEAGQYVKAGEAWLTFECPEIDSEANVCKISTSYVAVRNCLGATNEDT